MGDNMAEIYTSRGRLTRYGLSCGYIEQRWTKSAANTQVTLWMEHSVFHVRAHCHGLGLRIFWDAFRTLTEARRRFARALR